MFKTDEKGGIIDPPTIPEWEAKLNAAAAKGNADDIEDIQQAYHAAREEEAKRLTERQQRRDDIEADAAAERRDRQRAAEQQRAEEQAAEQERARAAAAEQAQQSGAPVTS